MTSARRILVIEDNSMNMELTCDLLELAGFAVVKAVTAEEGLPLAVSAHPDLILMDIALPGMDGLEATRRLKGSEVTRGIPILALTASAMRSDEERAFAAGCGGIIRKPIDTRTFAREIANFLETGSRTTGGTAP